MQSEHYPSIPVQFIWVLPTVATGLMQRSTASRTVQSSSSSLNSHFVVGTSDRFIFIVGAWRLLATTCLQKSSLGTVICIDDYVKETDCHAAFSIDVSLRTTKNRREISVSMTVTMTVTMTVSMTASMTVSMTVTCTPFHADNALT